MEDKYREDLMGMEPEDIAMMVYYMREIDLARFFNKLGDQNYRHGLIFFMEKISKMGRGHILNTNARKLINTISNDEGIRFVTKEERKEHSEYIDNLKSNGDLRDGQEEQI